jgi:hypothetical protein
VREKKLNYKQTQIRALQESEIFRVCFWKTAAISAKETKAIAEGIIN